MKLACSYIGLLFAFLFSLSSCVFCDQCDDRCDQAFLVELDVTATFAADVDSVKLTRYYGDSTMVFWIGYNDSTHSFEHYDFNTSPCRLSNPQAILLLSANKLDEVEFKEDSVCLEFVGARKYMFTDFKIDGKFGGACGCFKSKGKYAKVNGIQKEFDFDDRYFISDSE